MAGTRSGNTLGTGDAFGRMNTGSFGSTVVNGVFRSCEFEVFSAFVDGVDVGVA